MFKSSILIQFFLVIYLLSFSNAKPLRPAKIKLNIECDACNIVLPVVRHLVKNNHTTYLNFICEKLKIEDNAVCNSVLALYEVNKLKVYFLRIK
jgi:hypothetical protein